jgi:predicted hotdog family 3-hydroxylacyl-ACP dehydratase
MCLLDQVLEWSETAILCAADSHRAPDNPLRRDGRLGILCGVEYAAQAMALHTALTAAPADSPDAPPRIGYLASLRALTAHTGRLDTLDGALRIAADRLLGEPDRAIYRFTLHHADHLLLDGRLALVLT